MKKSFKLLSTILATLTIMSASSATFAGYPVYFSADYKHDPEKLFITGNGCFYIQ